MKSRFPTIRLAAALGLAGGLMIGCQNLLNPGQTANDAGATSADQTGALSLSIRNDSSCQGEWHAILDARSAGHPDSSSEAAFLASCVIEVKPGKDKPVPVVPPPLVPDSGTRCKWIAAQIDGGRDSLTVSYLKYCPDDCRKLEATDSASHEKMCREPRPHGDDSLPSKVHDDDSLPPKVHGDDSLPSKLHGDDSLPPKPHGDDTLMHAPKPADDSARLNHDTTMLPPPPKPRDDTSHAMSDSCKMLMTRLEAGMPGDSGRAVLETQVAAFCHEPIPLPPPVNCDELRLKMSSMDTTSVDYLRLASTLKEHCPEVPVK